MIHAAARDQAAPFQIHTGDVDTEQPKLHRLLSWLLPGHRWLGSFDSPGGREGVPQSTARLLLRPPVDDELVVTDVLDDSWDKLLQTSEVKRQP